MATGTGKTITAFLLVNHLIERKKIKGIVILAKGNDLLEQWYLNVLKHFKEAIFAKKVKIRIFREFKKHRMDEIVLLLDKLDDKNYTTFIIVVSSYDRFSKFFTLCKSHLNFLYDNILLICDEVHNLGSEIRMTKLKGKIEKFKYIVGLSATPERPYDQKGNEFIFSEIGKIIYRYNLEDAIKEGILCEFDYIPLKYTLTEDEKDKIASLFRKLKAIEKENETEANNLKIQIAKVKKTAKNKLEVFKDFLESYKNQSQKSVEKLLENCIIFVETKEYGLEVQKKLIDYQPNFRTYYGEDDESVLKDFANGPIKCLITCKRISEGIDIPAIDTIILFSNAKSQIETIQRIGRCLRTSPEKPNKRSIVIDFIEEDTNAHPDDEKELPTDKEREKFLTRLSKIKKQKT